MLFVLAFMDRPAGLWSMLPFVISRNEKIYLITYHVASFLNLATDDAWIEDMSSCRLGDISSHCHPIDRLQWVVEYNSLLRYLSMDSDPKAKQLHAFLAEGKSRFCKSENNVPYFAESAEASSRFLNHWITFMKRMLFVDPSARNVPRELFHEQRRNEQRASQQHKLRRRQAERKKHEDLREKYPTLFELLQRPAAATTRSKTPSVSSTASPIQQSSPATSTTTTTTTIL